MRPASLLSTWFVYNDDINFRMHKEKTSFGCIKNCMPSQTDVTLLCIMHTEWLKSLNPGLITLVGFYRNSQVGYPA